MSKFPRARSWPALLMVISWLDAGISSIADRISSMDPNGSAVPCTNSAGVRRRGKCDVRTSSGFFGGCRGYESNKRPSQHCGSSAASMVACRPPYEWPPRKTLSVSPARRALTAAFRPARSSPESFGEGGPNRRRCRNGKSQRNTVYPSSQNAVATAMSSGAQQLLPAPWLRISLSGAACNGR